MQSLSATRDGLGRTPEMQNARWLVLLRFLVLAICLLSVALAVPEDARPWPFASGFFVKSALLYLLLAGLFCLNLSFLLLLPHVRRVSAFVAGQILADIAVVSALVFLTGTVYSQFVNLYFACIMAASLLLSRKIVVVFACFSVVGLAAATTLWEVNAFSYAIDESYNNLRHGLPYEMRRMLLIDTAFFLVAYLAGLLQARLAMARILNNEVLQNLPEGVAVFDAKGLLVFHNQSFSDFFGAGQRLSSESRLEDIFPGTILAPVKESIRHGVAALYELPAADRPAPRPPLEARISHLSGAGGARGMVAMFIDISLRRRAEEAERNASRFAAIGEMAAGMAHEIRNPLASVRGSIQEVAGEFAEGTSQRMLCNIVIKESDRLDRIIGDFLQFARRRPIRLGRCDLKAMLEETRTLLSQRSDAAKITLRFECMPGIVIQADVEQLREVFLNLGINACAAMEGEGVLEVSSFLAETPIDHPVSTASDKGVLVTWEDSGPGIQPGSEDMIFAPFYTTKAQGTGLGLAIAQKVVQAHGGALWAETRPGGGARFCCWLPEGGPLEPPKRDTAFLLKQGREKK